MKKIIFLLTGLLIAINVFADPKGEEIAKKNFNLKSADDSYSLITMLLINKNGDKKIRKMDSYSKETGEGTNSFINFIEPADVKGTKFLTIAHKKSDDEQRLYLPALGKVRRISSSNKDENFMGSDLNYYDMEDHDYEDFTYKFLKEEKLNDKDCNVIEMTPVDPNAPYSKQIAWINKADDFMYKVECFDKKNPDQKFKTILFAEVKNINGILITTIIDVDNIKESHKTILKRENIKINTGLKDSIFSIQNLTN